MIADLALIAITIAIVIGVAIHGTRPLPNRNDDWTGEDE